MKSKPTDDYLIDHSDTDDDSDQDNFLKQCGST